MSGDPTAGGDSQRSNPTPFLTKTYQMVDDSNIDDLISWNENGSTFVVWKPAEFARDLLPKYFKHNNFSSFVRQLNTYGFRKIVSDRWEFANDFFKRGEKSLLKEIQRRKIPSVITATAVTPNVQALAVALPKTTAIRISPASSGDEQVLSSNSSPAPPQPQPQPAMLKACSSLPDSLVEENEKLKKENSKLREELNRLKGLCGNVYNLMSGYAVNRGESSEGRASELMQEVVEGSRKTADEEEDEEEEEMYPKLFGVSLGAKRLKRTEVEDLKQTDSLE